MSVRMDINRKSGISQLMLGFNNRDADAFGEMYLLLRDAAMVYCSLIYKNSTVEPDDIIQDIFTKLWLSNQHFDAVEKLKAYIYCAIKNSYINHLKHLKHVDSHIKEVEANIEESYEVDIVESELYAQIDQSLNSLPENYAKVIRLFMQGYKSGEIAKIIDKPEQIVYNIKNKVIKSLRKKFGESVPALLLLLK